MENSQTNTPLERAQAVLTEMFDPAQLTNLPGTAQQVLDRFTRSQGQAVRFMSAMTDAWTQMGTRLTPAGSFDPMDAFRSMTKVLGETSPLSQMLSTPGFGMFRENQADLGAVIVAAGQVGEKQLAYQQLVGRAWADAMKAMTDKLTERAGKGETPQTPRALLELWIEVADQVFLERFRSDEYAAAQSALMNASNGLRERRRALMEDALEGLDLPTRSSVDAGLEAIQALRREVKALKRRVTELESKQAPTG